MPGAGRLGDKAQVQGAGDAHGCPGCPHPASGPAISGSPTVFINGRPALRVDDVGIQAACCGPNFWTARNGAPTVNINGKAAYRLNDIGQSCGGTTKLIEGSDNVIIGQATSGGGGSGGEGAVGSSGADVGSSNLGGGGGAGSDAPASGSSASGGPSAASSSSSSDSSDGSSPTATSAPPDEHKSWIEVEVHDEDGAPLANADYKLELPDFAELEGSLDGSGRVRREQIASGLARFWVPEDDDSAWRNEQAAAAAAQQQAWLDVEIKDDQGRPLANQAVKLELPDGTVLDAKLDGQGRLRQEGIAPGQARIYLPDDDAAAGVLAAPSVAPPAPKAFFEIVMVDDAQRPLAGRAVKLRLPDGTELHEKLDEHGRLRKENLAPGDVQVFVDEEG